MTLGDVRVRRPRQHELLIQTLIKEAGFPTMRDLLLFAGSLGCARGVREPFDASSEPIRYETLTDPIFAESVLQMMAAAAKPEDAEIVGANKLQEAVTIFEEYANGGLGLIQGEINASHETSEQVCLRLVTEALAGDRQTRETIDDLADELSW